MEQILAILIAGPRDRHSSDGRGTLSRGSGTRAVLD